MAMGSWVLVRVQNGRLILSLNCDIVGRMKYESDDRKGAVESRAIVRFIKQNWLSWTSVEYIVQHLLCVVVPRHFILGICSRITKPSIRIRRTDGHCSVGAVQACAEKPPMKNESLPLLQHTL